MCWRIIKVDMTVCSEYIIASRSISQTCRIDRASVPYAVKFNSTICRSHEALWYECKIVSSFWNVTDVADVVLLKHLFNLKAIQQKCSIQDFLSPSDSSPWFMNIPELSGSHKYQYACVWAIIVLPTPVFLSDPNDFETHTIQIRICLDIPIDISPFCETSSLIKS